MMILAFVVIAAAMGFYVLAQSRTPIETGEPKPERKPRDPLLEARNQLRRQIEVMEGRPKGWRESTNNPWAQNTLEELRAELDEVERQLGEGAARP